MKNMPITIIIVSLLLIGSVAAAGQYTLRLGEMSFDPLTDFPKLDDQWRIRTSEGADLHLVQLFGPTETAWLDYLKSQNLHILQYIHPYTYIVWGELTHEREVLNPGIVRWSGPFEPAFRVEPRWRNLSRAMEQVEVLAVRNADSRSIIDRVESLGGRLTLHSSLNHIFDMLAFDLPGHAIREVARIPGVYSVQLPPKEGGLRGEMSNQVNVNNVNEDNLAYPGYMDWLNDVGLDGNGVIMANVDSGVQDNHPDLVNRIVDCEGETCGGSSSSDHGTHTAGIMAADGSSGVLDNYGFLRGLGVAPGANIVEQKYSPFYTQPDGMLLLMRDSYANGASVSGNSWGPSDYPEGYDNDTLQVDIGVRDASEESAGNQSMSYILSIMNGSGGTSSQGSPDEAKNIFTIGSTKMQTYGGVQELEIDDISYNSAHGPALDGRKIPHMVAPGCYVDSSIPTNTYGNKCGTSMASPHVSGAVALFIQYYRELFETDPSPAMIKSAFLVVARDLAGNEDADGGILGHPFDSKQGWGRMDLEAVLDSPWLTQYFDDPVILDATGDVWERTVYVDNTEYPVRLMLTWTDAPGHGLGGSTPAWNNDLDLEVTVNGDTYLGNRFGSDGWSEPGGSPDSMNNTEGIFLPAGTSGPVMVRVIGTNINSDAIPGSGDETDQDFALVITNVFNQSSDGVITLDRSVYAPGIDINIEVSDLDLHGLGSLNVTVQSDSEPAGETVSLAETGSDTGIFMGSITAVETTGAGQLTISHNDEIRAVYYDEDTGGGMPGEKFAFAAADTQGPVIDSVGVASLTSSNAVIRWDTGEAATSRVVYGSIIPPEIVMEDGVYTTDHVMEITDLEPCTVYYFSVLSEDQAGNLSVDDNSGVYYSFTTYDRILLINETMDTDPEWSMEGQWAWGQPAGQGGDHGSPDPASGHTGTNVLGYNLNGDYPPSIPEYALTTGNFDCTDCRDATLTFYRWLGVERPLYDHATLQISTNGGTSWSTIWENEDTYDGGEWEYMEYDISQWADGASDVSIRWIMGPTDTGWQYCGWNIDDVQVLYEGECNPATPTPAPTPTPEPCVYDGDVDNSGSLTPQDALASFQIYLGIIPDPTIAEECSADCNGSQSVTPEDALCIFLNYLSGSCQCAEAIP